MTNTPKHPYMQSFMTSRCLNYGGQSNGAHLKSLSNLRAADPTSKLISHYDSAIKKSMNDANKRARAKAAEGPLKIGEYAPNIALPNPDGKIMTLSELNGKVVLVDFWASWCGPCRKEMPLLDELHAKYSDLGFTVLGVNVEQQNQKAKEFINELNVSFPILLDEQNTVSKLYDVEAMPTTVVIDRNSNLRYVHYGYQAGDEKLYKKMVKALIRE